MYENKGGGSGGVGTARDYPRVGGKIDARKLHWKKNEERMIEINVGTSALRNKKRTLLLLYIPGMKKEI